MSSLQPPCDEFFSIYRLDGGSYENEIGFSTLCVSNTFKAVVFISLLVFFTMMFVVLLYLVIRQFQHSSVWSLKKKVFIINALQCLVQILIMAVHLSGIESRARYLLFGLPFVFILFSSMLVMASWLDSLRQILTYQPKAAEDSLRPIRLGFRLAFVANMVLLYSLFSIVPMIVYDQPATVNWVYSFAIASMGLAGFLNILSGISVINKLVRLCQPEPNLPSSEALAAVVAKLLRHKRLALALLPTTLFQGLFPLWVGLTATETSPGMEGHFYFHFLFFTVLISLAIPAKTWVVMKASHGGSSNQSSSLKNTSNSGRETSSRGKEKEKQETAKNFMFTVEELNEVTMD